MGSKEIERTMARIGKAEKAFTAFCAPYVEKAQDASNRVQAKQNEIDRLRADLRRSYVEDSDSADLEDQIEIQERALRKLLAQAEVAADWKRALSDDLGRLKAAIYDARSARFEALAGYVAETGQAVEQAKAAYLKSIGDYYAAILQAREFTYGNAADPRLQIHAWARFEIEEHDIACVIRQTNAAHR
ncbi:MAG: hypothetical protein LLG06_19360 [Desulfobacteraceae bacterium]|nr:hypothetical protein [Desulfobacteraceae bacterium]